MKILVGTLYAAEHEFSRCCASIRAQSHPHFDHLVIRDLPKSEAHQRLYGTFMEQRDKYELLVKVDADMVIEDPTMFERIVSRFEADPELDLLLIAVHDFFTHDLLTGMNIFRNVVEWDFGPESLFTDRTFRSGSVRKARKDLDGLAPAALHCPDPHPFQAFHYGFHRGITAVKGGKRWKELRRLTEHFRRSPDPRLALAILGANLAFVQRFGVEHVSYGDHALRSYFDEHRVGRSDEELRRSARLRLSRMCWLFKLPLVVILCPDTTDSGAGSSLEMTIGTPPPGSAK